MVEARDYPHGLVPEGELGHDTIKICEDTDGDGKADKFTIFADKLNLATSLVFVNGATTSYPEMPFGGVKTSGYGRELGGHGIKEFCNAKSVWVGPQEREGSESGSRTE